MPLPHEEELESTEGTEPVIQLSPSDEPLRTFLTIEELDELQDAESYDDEEE